LLNESASRYEGGLQTALVLGLGDCEDGIQVDSGLHEQLLCLVVEVRGRMSLGSEGGDTGVEQCNFGGLGRNNGLVRATGWGG
jgi:hypothetical protein